MGNDSVRISVHDAEAGLSLRAGELVEVRSEEEILATLDDRGELDSLPFMPEMLQYCGKQFTVYKAAHKACDTLTKPSPGIRRMRNAVHLAGVRCDGQAHGGCQAACLTYWKEAWLKRVDDRSDGLAPTGAATPPDRRPTVADLYVNTHKAPGTAGEERFACQVTELPRAAPELLPLRDMSQYVQDVRSGNVGVLAVLRAVLVGLFNRYQSLSARVLPERLRFRGGLRWGFLRGSATKTPTGRTDLRPGERVRIKPKAEIMRTLDSDLQNRGLGFDPEMARYCGREARVLRRVEQIIDERTGELLHMKNPCIMLENVVCEGAYNSNCPRSIYAYWREIWLERVDSTASDDQESATLTSNASETA